MSSGGLPVACDLACELRLPDRAEPARVRTCSLSRCFVQTDLALTPGTPLELYVSGPAGRKGCSVQARIQRALHERFVEDEPVRGIELSLIEVGPAYFSIYSDLCQQASAAEPPSLSVVDAEAGQAPERRRSERTPLELPIRLFSKDVSFVGATRDLSSSGAFIETDSRRSVGECLHMELLAARSFFAEGVVVRTERDGTTSRRGFAIRLLSIEELIESARRGAAPEGAPLHLRLRGAEDLGWIYLEQIQKGALFVPGASPVTLNSLVDVVLELQDQAETLRIKGRVIKIFGEPQGLGLQLLHRDSVVAWCEARLRG